MKHQDPYYAVIFTSIKSSEDEGYNEMATSMLNLAESQPGFLGFESARDKIGITISYWKDLESIKTWKMNTEHLQAQRQGIKKWYEFYKVRIAKVEREYEFHK